MTAVRGPSRVSRLPPVIDLPEAESFVFRALPGAIAAPKEGLEVPGNMTGVLGKGGLSRRRLLKSVGAAGAVLAIGETARNVGGLGASRRMATQGLYS